MSEYQFYDFQAIDRPLSEADRSALRDISTRARITARRFTNSYQWGDFKGDPDELMARWFDLHLYFANWGSRRLAIKLPARLVDKPRLETMLDGIADVELRAAGDALILDIRPDEMDPPEFDEHNEGLLDELAPLRADLMAGDLRLVYLLWLWGVATGDVADETPEPLAGIGPLSDALACFADFFLIDTDLVAVAAERQPMPVHEAPTPEALRAAIAAMSEEEKTDYLLRVALGDLQVAAELGLRARPGNGGHASADPPRTAAQLREAAEARREARDRAAAAKALRAQRLREAEEAQRRRDRLAVLERQGERVWDRIEEEVARRNAGGYDIAATMLGDLAVLAAEKGETPAFRRRLEELRARHRSKRRFIERLSELG